jgi:hypothetical protein
MPVTGSCHCGKIAFTLDEETPTKAVSCNCSICRRRGWLLHASTLDKLHVEGSPDDIQVYTFNKHAILHQFCKTCGCAPFARSAGEGDKVGVMINLRCADGIDPDALEIQHYDGASA